MPGTGAAAGFQTARVLIMVSLDGLLDIHAEFDHFEKEPQMASTDFLIVPGAWLFWMSVVARV